MTSRDFCYWLQGFFELSEAGSAKVEDLDLKEVQCIKNHLAMVFAHEIDPSHGDKKHQDLLGQIHLGGGAKINC